MLTIFVQQPISRDEIIVQNLTALKLNSKVDNSADRRTEQPIKVKTSMKELEDEKRIQVGNMCDLEGESSRETSSGNF